jgi:hypothetical protein
MESPEYNQFARMNADAHPSGVSSLPEKHRERCFDARLAR